MSKMEIEEGKFVGRDIVKEKMKWIQRMAVVCSVEINYFRWSHTGRL